MAQAPPGDGPVKTFFRELRRRRVLEAAGLYIAGGWVLIEAADILFPIFNLPPFGMRIFVIVVFASFPLILILAWTFDISLSGLVRTPDAAEEASRQFNFDEVPQRSIAVLPFANMTGKGAEYLGDGVAEELLNLLSRIEGLKVAARTSSFAFKERDTDVREIGQLLGVWHVLEGSVRQAGSRIRISAQLVEAPNGYHLWSETFDRELDDIFAIQDEISAAIVEALHPALANKGGQKRREDEPPTDSIEAYQYVLRANYLWQRRGADAIKGAIAALEQAIELDPDYAEAFARLAAAEAILHEYTLEPREPGFARAESYARKAIALDRTLGEPHGVLGYMALRLWRWQESERHLRKSIELQDSLPTLHQWYSNLLNDLGRHDDARREAGAAHALDPLSPSANVVLAYTAMLQPDDDTAATHGSIAREYGLGGGIPDYVDLIINLRRAAYDEAASGWRRFLKHSGIDATWLESFLDGMRDSDLRAAAGDALAQAMDEGTIDERYLFFHYCLLADARVFDVAETMLADHALNFIWLFLPEADALIHHPRFKRLMATLGILDYWRQTAFPERFEFLD